MVNLVLVSHSARLAEGVAELAAEMGGGEVLIEPAGGIDDGAIGTDAERVRAAVERVRSDDGVLVLMDLGSALMSAEIALEMLEAGGPVMLTAAPLVEGAVAAAARARGGAELAEVAAEARGALAAKAAQLGEEDDEAPGEKRPRSATASRVRLPIGNRLGLHVRPAGRIIELVADHDASRRAAQRRPRHRPDRRPQPDGDRAPARGAGRRTRGRRERPAGERAPRGPGALAAANWGDAPDAAADGAAARAARPARRGAGPSGAAPDRRGAPPARRFAASPPCAGSRSGRRGGSRPPELDLDALEAGSPDEEAARLDEALAVARAQLAETAAGLPARRGRDLRRAGAAARRRRASSRPLAPRSRTASRRRSPTSARARTTAEAFEGIDDDYLRARAIDVRDVAHRVVAAIAGAAPPGAPAEPGIVVADVLTPGAVASLDPEVAWGIAAARGGTLDHAAIVAGALGIPYVVGLGAGAALGRRRARRSPLDGDSGEVDGRARRHRRVRGAAAAAAAEAAPARWNARPSRSSWTAGASRCSRTSAARPMPTWRSRTAPRASGCCAPSSSILGRTEPPSEDEQVEALTEIATRLKGRPLIVRTLDAGADKPLPFIATEPEDNPFLGTRGLRLSLVHPELFPTQLRAILRVAAEHPVSVMFPMVSTVDEVLAARELLGPTDIEVGAMIEVPAAALQADLLAPHLDFFSIGTNDLSQYTMAAERGNPALAPLLEAAQQPVLALIDATVRAAERHGRWVGVCGELAGDPEAAVRLVDLGVRELSMAPGRIPAVKERLRRWDADER